jgi:hypothetical protein
MDSREPSSHSFNSVLDTVWTLLADGQRLRQSPFHQGVLGTSTPRGPSVRYVVLRRVDRDRGVLAFHTDRRSEKWAELQRDPRVSLCFHGQGVQVRAEGRAELHTDDEDAELQWQRTGLMSRRAYLCDPGPGGVLSAPGSGLPAHLVKDRPTEAESAAVALETERRRVEVETALTVTVRPLPRVTAPVPRSSGLWPPSSSAASSAPRC